MKARRTATRDDGVTATADPDEALAISEERLRCVVQLSADYYWEHDPQHRFTLLHQPAADGSSPDPCRFLGKTFWDFGATPLTGSWAEHRTLCESHQPFRDMVVRRLDSAGRERFFSVSGEPMFDSAGCFAGYRGIARDVTSPHREERLLKLERAVAEILAQAAAPDDALTSAIRTICESESWDSGQYWSLD